MRFPVILTIVAFLAGFLAPAVMTTTSAHAAGFNAPAAADTLFAAKKKKKKRTKVETNKDEYLKAAPGTGPSGPATK
jgi:hypothetical protein